jgi:hypothetical protein
MKSFQLTLAAALVSLAAAGAHAQAVEMHDWGNGLGSAPTLNIGSSISAVQSLAKSNYGDNPQLMNSAWAHAGGAPWYAFQLTSTGNVNIDLTPVTADASFNPALTLWATGSSIFNGGSEEIETGTNNGWGAPHSFNAVGQVGDNGTKWASGAAGNIQQTLAYAVTGPSHTDSSQNGWGEVINAGVNDISTDNTFENGVTGTATGNSIHMTVNNMAAGWYVVFMGGNNNALSSANYQLTLTAAVPEPEGWALMLAGLGVVASVVRRTRRQA